MLLDCLWFFSNTPTTSAPKYHLRYAVAVSEHVHMVVRELHTVQDGLWSDWQRKDSKELDQVERVAQRPTVQAQTEHLHMQRQLWRCFTSLGGAYYATKALCKYLSASAIGGTQYQKVL